jgi:Mechanosensitive ion channel, beta-domain
MQEVAFQLIDKDGNGDIEKREMREAVQCIYRERKTLTAGLKVWLLCSRLLFNQALTGIEQDVSSAVAKLDGVLLFVAILAIAFVALLVFDRTDALTSLVPLATIVLGFSFIFGHSAQTLFESASSVPIRIVDVCLLIQILPLQLIFIFSTHVYDVGDLVMIDDQVNLNILQPHFPLAYDSQVLLVREFGLFSTTFRRVDGQEIIAPNALLARYVDLSLFP